MYKLVIPTAGIGSRIGPYTKFKNKALVSVGLKPAIIKVIEKFEDAGEIVIITGYESQSLVDAVCAFFPDWNIKFIHVENYSGEGSGLGFTLLKAKDSLQCPFIFTPNDAIFELFDFKGFKSPGNRICYYTKKSNDGYKLEQYRTISYEKNLVSQIFSKGVGTDHIYTGLCKIDDYSEFWKAMDNPIAITAGEVVGLTALKKIEAVEAINWLDCGTIESLAKTKKFYENSEIHILEKQDEAIWFAEDKVIKFSKDENFIKGRLNRHSLLPPALIPTILDQSAHTYTYSKIPGDVYDSFTHKGQLNEILDIMHEKMWTDYDKVTPKERLDEICISFYKDKTLSRSRMYFDKYEAVDTCLTINGLFVPSLSDSLKKVNWENFCSKSIWANFHGDFHPENIIICGEGFKLIDWRQNFGASHDISGDIYYDLSKFLHGLEVNHGIIHQDLFDIKWTSKNAVDIDIFTKNSLIEAYSTFVEWITLKGYDINHVKLLTALIYINIAALHEYPYSEFLHLYGRLKLQQQIEQ